MLHVAFCHQVQLLQFQQSYNGTCGLQSLELISSSKGFVNLHLKARNHKDTWHP